MGNRDASVLDYLSVNEVETEGGQKRRPDRMREWEWE